MDKQDERRVEVEDADDTGMVASEELITKAETMLPLLRQQAALPHADLHAALPEGHEAHGTIDELHAEMHKDAPNPQVIERHVGTLRVLPELEALVVNWWDSPKTQRFFAILAQIGV
jgi:hypothetical protein